MVEREEEGERKEVSEKDVTYILVYTTIGQPNSVRISTMLIYFRYICTLKC